MMSATQHEQQRRAICPVALSRKLELLQMEEETIEHGSSDASSLVMQDFEAALIERNSREATDIIDRYVDILRSQRKMGEVKELYAKAIDGLQDTFCWHHSSSLFLCYRLGRCLQDARDFQAAEEVYRRSLHGLDPRNPYKLYLFNELGVACAEQLKLDDAEKALQMALYGFQEIWGFDHMWAHTAAINLGDVYKAQGRLETAVVMFRKGILGLSKTGPAFHRVAAGKAPNLIRIYEGLAGCGHWEEAWRACHATLATYERLFGTDDERTLRVVWDLAILSRHSGMSKEFRRLMKRAVAGLQDSDHALDNPQPMCNAE